MAKARKGSKYCNTCKHRPKGKNRGKIFFKIETGNEKCVGCSWKVGQGNPDNYQKDPKKKFRRAPKKNIWQGHHIVYQGGLHASKQKDIVRRIRMGIHGAITTIRRYKALTPEEVDAIKIEAELRRSYDPANEIDGYIQEPDPHEAGSGGESKADAELGEETGRGDSDIK